MYRALLFLLISLSPALADEQTAVATVQRMFDAMAHHDADTARALFAPSATLVSVRQDGTAVVTPFEKWVERMGTTKDAWLERMWNPKVLEKGSIAVVWAEYDFHLNGKFSHCGIDSVSLLKGASGWKVASITYTNETTSCAPSPLGPPAGLSTTVR
jgi:Domain of unknown function (DUF4440)